MAVELHYPDLAIRETRGYIEKQRECLKKGDKEAAHKARQLFEMELLELYRAFQVSYPEKKGLQGSFWDFITELQNTPLNYEKSLADLYARSPWFQKNT